MNYNIGSVLFYRLCATSWQKVVPLLVDKIYQQQKRMLILAESPAICTELDQSLWTYTPLSFLPHGCDGKDVQASEHPIWISTQLADPRDIVMLTPGSVDDGKEAHFEKALILFSAYCAEDCLWAQEIYERCKGQPSVFWEQDKTGWKEIDPCFSFIP